MTDPAVLVLLWNDAERAALGQGYPDTMEAQGQLLLDLRAAKKLMGDAERALEGVIAEGMASKQVTITGLGTFERKWSPASTKWEHEAVARQLAALSRDERILDESTGVIEGEAEAAARVLLAAAGVGYWRVGELKKRGLDPKDFREQEGGRYTIRVTA